MTLGNAVLISLTVVTSTACEIWQVEEHTLSGTYVMVLSGGLPPDSVGELRHCPPMMESRLDFDRKGSVAMRHTFIGFGDSEPTTVELVTDYSIRGRSVSLHLESGRTAELEITDGGHRLRTTNSRCYPGHTGGFVDRSYELIYERRGH